MQDERKTKESDTISKKSQRLRKYFSEVAKEMILADGIEQVTIRKIASEAGYAYTTIYNHFENLDELLWLTRSLIIDDINDYIKNNSANNVQSDEDVYTIFKVYTDYFIKNPEAYNFLYFYSLKKTSKTTTSHIETEEYKQQFEKTFEYLLMSKTAEEVAQSLKMIMYIIHGLLTLCISQNDELSIEEMHNEIKDAIYFILNK